MSDNIYSYDDALKASVEYFDGDDFAAKVFVDKYSLRDNENNILEKTPTDMHHRLAKEFARIEKNKFKNPLSEEEIFNLFDHFKQIIVAGSPMSAIGNPFQVQSLGNCFTLINPVDSYGGILYADQQIVQISKRRGGVGLCIDNLRPKGFPTRNAAKTTDGISVFMERFANSCKEVAQHGRRGALLIALSVHHPEIETFINIKKDLEKVTAANISVKITDDFMKAVKEDKEYEQRWPIYSDKPIISKMVSAKKIWDQIIDSAWTCADPGVLFIDTIKKYSLSDQYKIKNPTFEDTVSNPCITGDTLICTDKGHISVKDIINNGIDKYKIKTYNISINTIELEDIIYAGKTKIDANVIKIELEDGEKLQLTPDHKIYTLHPMLGYIKSSSLKIGDEILKIDEDYTFSAKIKKIIPVKNQDVYDITTKSNHNFFANNILVKNCGEICMGADTCRLASINLFSFVKNPFTSKAFFDYNEFKKTVGISQRLLDDMIELEIEAIDKILLKIKEDPEPENIKQIEIDTWKLYKENCILGRRTGLGITALGDTLASLGMKYGSEESIKETEKVYKYLAIASMESSCLIAKELGTFPLYDAKVEKDNLFLERILKTSNELRELHEKYGRRNISLTTTAPTGSLSVLTQTTSGIEPVFALSYTRKRRINPEDRDIKFGIIDETGDKWEENKIYHHKLQTWMEITGEKNISKSPYNKTTSKDIDPAVSVDIQAAAQKWVSHSISKTANLPNNASRKIISELFMRAYDKKCKGFTIYREGSRQGILIDDVNDKDKIIKVNAIKRPDKLPCNIHHVKITKRLDKPRHFEYIVAVGLLKDDPYEIFAFENGKLDKKYEKGYLVKKKRGHYDIEFDDGTILDNIMKDQTEEEEVVTRLISISLRHGTDISFIVHQLEKTKGDLLNFTKSISRTLKHYIQDGKVVSGEDCPECIKNGIKNTIVRKNGCQECAQCGWSRCS